MKYLHNKLEFRDNFHWKLLYLVCLTILLEIISKFDSILCVTSKVVRSLTHERCECVSRLHCRVRPPVRDSVGRSGSGDWGSTREHGSRHTDDRRWLRNREHLCQPPLGSVDCERGSHGVRGYRSGGSGLGAMSLGQAPYAAKGCHSVAH